MFFRGAVIFCDRLVNAVHVLFFIEDFFKYILTKYLLGACVHLQWFGMLLQAFF